MKLGKLAAGAAALALSLALVPSVASAAESGLSNEDTFMILQAKNPVRPGYYPEGAAIYYYTANLTATRDGNPVDAKQVHYGDQIVVTTGKPALADGSEHDWKEPFSTKQTLKIHSGFTSNPTPPVGDKYLWQPTGVVNTSEAKTVAPTEEGKFTYTVDCQLKPGERFAFLDARYDKTVNDTSPTTYGSSYDDAQNVALLSFTINDPEGAAKCGNNNSANPGNNSQAGTNTNKTSTSKANQGKHSANSNNHDKKVEQKPVKKDSLSPTGAIALVATALAGTLLAVGGGITYLSRRRKQRI